MTALPSNLAFVGEDLARATLQDARRSARQRRAATVSLALAVLIVTATAAVANGWLFGQTPTLRAVPALGGVQGRGAFAPGDAVSAVKGVAQSETEHRAATPGAGGSPPLGSAAPGESQTLLTNLGPQQRVLSTVATTSGGVCFALTDFPIQCIPTFTTGQQIAWAVSPSATGTTLIWGITRDDVESVEAISDDGGSITAQLANNGFYVEVSGSQPARLVLHLSDGTTDVEALPPCPSTDPTCTK